MNAKTIDIRNPLQRCEDMVVVTISGQPGCGSTSVGKLLAKKLGVEFFSVGDYTKKLALDISSEPEETRRAVEFWASKKGSSKEHHYETDMMVKTKATEGRIVIDGKIAIHMLRGFCDISVWLKAPFDTRAERVAKRDKISKQEAEKILKEKERLEGENFQRLYRFDYFGQADEADMVVDVGDKKPEEIVEIILKEIGKRKLV